MFLFASVWLYRPVSGGLAKRAGLLPAGRSVGRSVAQVSRVLGSGPKFDEAAPRRPADLY